MNNNNNNNSKQKDMKNQLVNNHQINYLIK